MKHWKVVCGSLFLGCAVLFGMMLLRRLPAADHNDPNAVNSIFSDIDISAADLYDMFGWPSDDTSGGEKVVLALTFAPVPKTGVFDTDLLYRIRLYANRRVAPPLKDDQSAESLLKYFDAIKDRYLNLKAAEVRVVVDKDNRAKVDFIDFPSGSFSKVIDTNKAVAVEAAGGHTIKAYIGGRDDAFFNDLPGFFRSINYAPQFYRVPHSMTGRRELMIPKTLIELEGNKLFNFDPKNPKHGQEVKLDLPQVPLTWSGNKYFKDQKGNYRFVYSGRDAQAGRNINAIILEIPLAFITKSPQTDRIVNAWGESWVLKAANKIETIPDERLSAMRRFWEWAKRLFSSESSFDEQLRRYKVVDTDGQAFADAGLNEREDDAQVGAKNFLLGPGFVTRLAHLGWGFGPSISALGLRTSFDHDNSPISIHRTYGSVLAAFPRVKKVVFQQLNMPDDKWNKRKLNIPLRKAFEIFVPNVNYIDMDTTGTWPYGRRPEDQVATRFLALFLDMQAELGGKKYNLETLGDQSLWNQTPIEPKTPPNPLRNDKEFLKRFPYLAEPW